MVAICVVAIGYALMQLGVRGFGYATIFFGLAYLAYRHFIFSDLAYSMNARFDALGDRAYFSFTPYVVLLITSIAVPYVQFIRVGNLQYGKLRGDVSLSIHGHEFFLPFVSALVFCVLWFGSINTFAFGETLLMSMIY